LLIEKQTSGCKLVKLR